MFEFTVKLLVAYYDDKTKYPFYLFMTTFNDIALQLGLENPPPV
jgi:hypothetical protein